MSAKDLYHAIVRRALAADGWTITHDPYRLVYGQRKVFVDLGAEGAIGAERSGRRIAVEIKSFLSPSPLRDFELAIGQYLFYRSLLGRTDPDRELYLAVTDRIYDDVFLESIARPIIEDQSIRTLVFRPDVERIVRWTP